MIQKVILNPREQFYIVFGDGKLFSPQVIQYDEMQEWSTINDFNGDPLYDIQIDDNNMWEDENKPDYTFQYVSIDTDKNGFLGQQGDDFKNIPEIKLTELNAEKITGLVVNFIFESIKRV